MKLKEILKQSHKYAAEYTQEAAMENNETPEEYEEALIKQWALDMVESEEVGEFYEYWEGEAPYPTEVVAKTKDDMKKLIEESVK